MFCGHPHVASGHAACTYLETLGALHAQAAGAGNVAACVCTAQLMERWGDEQAAMKFWGKAARVGHPEGQYRLGKVWFPLPSASHESSSCLDYTACHTIQVIKLVCCCTWGFFHSALQ